MSEIKKFCLAVNNIMIYLLFIFVFLASGFFALSGNILLGLVVFVGLSVAASLMSGYYILIHSILIENEKQSKLLENILRELKKELKK